MKLHENKEDFTEAVQTVSRGLNISPALVEKDYYVTLVLKRINEEVTGLIFKGGTSLSKCHKVINRFSEDIDLTLDSEHLTMAPWRNGKRYLRVLIGTPIPAVTKSIAPTEPFPSDRGRLSPYGTMTVSRNSAGRPARSSDGRNAETYSQKGKKKTEPEDH